MVSDRLAEGASADWTLPPDVPETYQLGRVEKVEPVTVGSQNRNWRIWTETGSYGVKQVLDVDLDRTRRQQRTVLALADRGFPVPAPLQPLCVRDDGVFEVVPWVAGEHRRGEDLTLADCERFGGFLGRLHLELAGVADRSRGPAGPAALEPPPERIWEESSDPAETLAWLHDLVARLTGLTQPTSFDSYVLDQVPTWIALLEKHGDRRPADGYVGPAGWIHGDFHDRNALWRDGRVVAVVDWDRLRIAPLWQEPIRAAAYMFDYDLPRMTAFIAGYRRVVTISDADFADGVRRWWFGDLTGLWPLNAHYDKGDDSCDRFFVQQVDRIVWWTANLDEITATLSTSVERSAPDSK